MRKFEDKSFSSDEVTEMSNESSQVEEENGWQDFVESVAGSEGAQQKLAELATRMESMEAEILHLKEQLAKNENDQGSVVTECCVRAPTTESQRLQSQETIADSELQGHLVTSGLKERVVFRQDVNIKLKEKYVEMAAAGVVLAQAKTEVVLKEPKAVKLNNTSNNKFSDDSTDKDKNSMDKDKNSVEKDKNATNKDKKSEKCHSRSSSRPPMPFAPGDQVYRWFTLAGFLPGHHHAIVMKVYWDDSDERWMLEVNDLSNTSDANAGGGKSKSSSGSSGSSGGKFFLNHEKPAFWRSYSTPVDQWHKVIYQAPVWQVQISAAGTCTGVKCDPAELTLERAQFLQYYFGSPLANTPYHWLYNNCEAAAVWCKTGEYYSPQALFFLNSADKDIKQRWKDTEELLNHRFWDHHFGTVVSSTCVIS
jgi:hypothetical protein